jgi:dTDP-4-dehydrorhamnose reductase
MDLANLASESDVIEALGNHELASIYAIGGMTYVDGCEDTPDIAFRTNERGPAVLAAYAHQLGIPFIYLSTEYVFDGETDHVGPYREEDTPKPKNVYGQSKLAGETAVLMAYPEALVLRTTVVYGPDAQQKNYLYTVLRHLRDGVPLLVPKDQISTPTYNVDLIEAMLKLVKAGATGIYHLCGPELLDRLTFAQSIATYFGLDSSLLRGVSTFDLNQRASRPLFAGLNSSRAIHQFPELRLRPISEALLDCTPIIQTFLRNDSGQNK